MDERDCCCGRKKVRARSEEEKKTIEVRLNRVIGQLNGIKKMIEEDRYCDDVLTQLSAADKSLQSLAVAILDGHMRGCIAEEIRNGDDRAIDEVVELFKKFR